MSRVVVVRAEYFVKFFIIPMGVGVARLPSDSFLLGFAAWTVLVYYKGITGDNLKSNSVKI
jgi:hypothetical protein